MIVIHHAPGKTPTNPRMFTHYPRGHQHHTPSKLSHMHTLTKQEVEFDSSTAQLSMSNKFSKFPSFEDPRKTFETRFCYSRILTKKEYILKVLNTHLFLYGIEKGF